MAKVIFTYDGMDIEIQCNINDQIKNILQKYSNKIEKNLSDLFFTYNGNKINDNSILNEIMNEEDKKGNTMNILVIEFNENNIPNKDENKIPSKEIICPKCNENILIKINEYKLNLFNCKNNHEINNILIKEFENIEKIDISKIICNKCKTNNKSNTFHNEFYRCNKCKFNLCPLCNSHHDKNHNTINFDNKNYICEIHNMPYIKYCENCKLNICMSCFKKHEHHLIINYENIILNESKKIKRIF